MRAPQQLTGPRRASARSNMGRNRRANSVAQQGGRRVATNPGSTGVSRAIPRSTGTPRAPVRPTNTVNPTSPANMQNAYQNFMLQYQQTMGADPLLQDLFKRRKGLNDTLRQKQAQYLQSLGLTPEQMRNPLLTQLIAPGIQKFMQQQQEYTILRNLQNSQEQYMNQRYPDLVRQQQEYFKQMQQGTLQQQPFMPQQQPPQTLGTQMPLGGVANIPTYGEQSPQTQVNTQMPPVQGGGTYPTMGNDIRVPPGFNPDGTPVQGVSANPTMTGGTPAVEQATQVGGGRVLPDYEKDFIVPGSRPDTGTTTTRPRPFVDPRIEPRKERVPNRPSTPAINQPKPVSGPRPGLATPRPQGN